MKDLAFITHFLAERKNKMCGIVGFLTSRVDLNLDLTLEKMTDAIAHRGPNDKGLHSDLVNCKMHSLGFGHRRLSIIDLTEHAHQPMIEGELSLVFNGEIYNYIELREKLIALGKKFESVSDTEVILKAYEQWGEQCFSYFNGMWAIAIYDKRIDKLILSRDRFGKKPLYYYIDNEKVVFASEIKSILLYPEVQKKPNLNKIYRYLSTSYRYIDMEDSSYFEGINSVQKSSYIIFSSDFSSITYKYWNLNENSFDFKNKKESQIIDDFRDLLIDSVKIRLRSDVPVSCMLSGGMDSTSIACIAHKILKTPVLTFSGITGEEKGIYDESEYIDEVVRETNAKHKYIMPEPTDLFDTVKEMLLYHDEPICTVSWYTLYQIAKQIKAEGVSVVLNGHGGDELLAGYWYHYQYNFFDIESANDFEKLDHEQKAWLNNHDRKIMEICRSRQSIAAMSSKKLSEVSQYPDYSSCFNLDFKMVHNCPIELYSEFTTELSKRLHKELLWETIPASLRAEDRNTMANSIESRSPMLDYRLVEYCFSLPNEYKIRNGIGKWVLREAMKGILPEKVRTRKDKAGFLAPADKWFRMENKDQIRELINSDTIKNIGIFNIDALNKIFDEHLCENANHHMFLWQFINIGLWYEIFWSKDES